MEKKLNNLVNKIKSPEGKIIIGTTLAGFTFPLIGMTLDDIIEGKNLMYTLTNIHSYVTPAVTALLTGVTSYYFGKHYVNLQRRTQKDMIKLNKIINDPEIGIYSRKEDGSITFANPTFANLLGYESSDEVIKNCNMKNIFMSDEERHEEVGQLIENKRIYNKKLRFRKKDGSVLLVTANVRIDEQGTINGMIQKLDDNNSFETFVVCSYCDKIREGLDYGKESMWLKATEYFMIHQDEIKDKKYILSHGICSPCYLKVKEELKKTMKVTPI